MHSAIVAGCFLLLILVPCLVAMKSSAKEGRTGNSGEHDLPGMPRNERGHSPSRLREAADAMAALKAERLAADQAVVSTTVPDRPSRLRMAAAAAFSRPAVAGAFASPGERPSRIRMVAAALTQRRQVGPVPMAEGDPGRKKQSIRELRARHAVKSSTRS